MIKRIKLLPKRPCKLTDENDRTYGGMQWGPGITHETNGEGDLCGPGWLHYYHDPYLAVLLNPMHADFKTPHLWRVEVGARQSHDYGLKSGTTRLTTVKRLSVPLFDPNQRVAFAIFCALAVCNEPNFVKWANAWLDGLDRSVRSAWAAAWAAAAWAAAAVRAAVRAAEATAEVAAEAAEAAASAARWLPKHSSQSLNLPSLARKAYLFERGTTAAHSQI